MKTVSYDYKERKKKVEEILDNTDKVNEVTTFPKDETLPIQMVIRLGLQRYL